MPARRVRCRRSESTTFPGSRSSLGPVIRVVSIPAWSSSSSRTRSSSKDRRDPDDLQEPPLEPGAGEGRPLFVELERLTNLGLTSMSLGPPEQVLHLTQVEQLEVVGDLDVATDRPRAAGDRDVEDRPGERRHRDAFPSRPVGSREVGPVDG
jgi:hypothetical protein